jgi:2-polyprenyl-6-methoxyphenol hydroxylase-like FAD-dependent oxidoreductase
MPRLMNCLAVLAAFRSSRDWRAARYIVENRHIRAGFCCRGADAEAASDHGMGVQSVATHDAHATLLLSDGRELRAPVAIAADGRGSLRRQMNIRVTGWIIRRPASLVTVAHASASWRGL